MIGFGLLALAYGLLHGENELLAQQIVAAGFCLLLFTVALFSWLSVRKDLRARQQQAQDEEDERP